MSTPSMPLSFHTTKEKFIGGGSIHAETPQYASLTSYGLELGYTVYTVY